MQKLKLSSQKSFLNLGIVLFVLTTGFILFSCNKESSTPQVNTAEARSLQESEALQDENSDKMVNTAALGLLNLSKDAAFRGLIHSKCNEQFDGDYNVLLKYVVTPAAQIGIDLKRSFLQSIQANASLIEALPSKLPYGYFTDEANIGKSVDGYDYFEHKFFLQIYVPNFEEGNVDNRQPAIVVFPEDNQTCTPGAYVLDENGVFQPRVIDETFVKDNLIWVVSINENTDNQGVVLSAKVNDVAKTQTEVKESTVPTASSRAPDEKNVELNEIMISDRQECLFGGRADVYCYVGHFTSCSTLSTLGDPDPTINVGPLNGVLNQVENCLGKFGKFKMKKWCSVTGLARYMATPFPTDINGLRQEEGLSFFIYEKDTEKKKNKKTWRACGTGFAVEYYSKDGLYMDKKYNYGDVPNYSPLKYGQWEEFDSNDILGTNCKVRLMGKIFRL